MPVDPQDDRCQSCYNSGWIKYYGFCGCDKGEQLASKNHLRKVLEKLVRRIQTYF